MQRERRISNAVSKPHLDIEIPALTVKRLISQLALARVPGAGHRRKMRLFTRISTPSQAVQVIEASIPTTEAVASKRPQDAAVKTIEKGKTRKRKKPKKKKGKTKKKSQKKGL
jgi:hypothetical protein